MSCRCIFPSLKQSKKLDIVKLPFSAFFLLPLRNSLKPIGEFHPIIDGGQWRVAEQPDSQTAVCQFVQVP